LFELDRPVTLDPKDDDSSDKARTWHCAPTTWGQTLARWGHGHGPKRFGPVVPRDRSRGPVGLEARRRRRLDPGTEL